MPELPEVENIAQGLHAEILGRTISSLRVPQPTIIKGPLSARSAARRLPGQAVSHVYRRAKRLLLITPDLALVFQLGMTGRILLHHHRDPHAPHTHLILHFTDDTHLRFVDPRRFGHVWFLPGLTLENADAAMTAAGMGPLGPDADRIAPAQFRQLLAKTHRPLKSLLLDQSRIAGLGNIYADEALFAARIHPETPADALDPDQAETLRRAIRQTLALSIKHGGTTFSDYRNAQGQPGRFLSKLKVYQRTNQPCPRCQTPIARITLNNRSTHLCPRCQPKTN